MLLTSFTSVIVVLNLRTHQLRSAASEDSVKMAKNRRVKFGSRHGGKIKFLDPNHSKIIENRSTNSEDELCWPTKAPAQCLDGSRNGSGDAPKFQFPIEIHQNI